MWSENKYVDITINVLLFLVGINFLHLGQLILPIICLIQFVDNKFKFYVANIKAFVVLCLFAISFCYFSYDLGYYCVMGFCLPMAYYIGSNLRVVNEENVKKIIYIIAFGMAIHVVANFAYNVILLGNNFIYKHTHYDIWVGENITNNATSVNMTFLLSLIYYLVIYEKNKVYKITGISLFSICVVYDLFLGRRTPLFILLVVLFLTTILDTFIINKKKPSKIVILIGLFILLVVGIVILLALGVFGTSNVVYNLSIVTKFRVHGFSSGRLEILIESIENMPKYLWGGQQISNVVGIQAHDLLTDIYDYSGIIPFSLFIIYMINIYKPINKILNKEYIIMFNSLYIGIFIQCCLEPIITGASLFLICVIMIQSILERVRNE